MNRPLACLLILSLGLAGCGDAPVPEVELRAYEDARRLQEKGDFEAALTAWRDLRRSARDRRVLAKVELGLAQVETALERRDLALERLSEVPSMTDDLPLAAVEAEISRVVAPFRGTPFEAALVEQAGVARQTARDRAADRRRLEVEVAATLVEQGEYAAALHHLRQVELRREAGDNADVVEALLLLRERAEADAAEVLADLARRRQDTPAAARSWIEAESQRFRGTRAYADLLTAILELGPSSDDAPVADDGP